MPLRSPSKRYAERVCGRSSASLSCRRSTEADARQLAAVASPGRGPSRQHRVRRTGTASYQSAADKFRTPRAELVTAARTVAAAVISSPVMEQLSLLSVGGGSMPFKRTSVRKSQQPVSPQADLLAWYIAQPPRPTPKTGRRSPATNGRSPIQKRVAPGDVLSPAALAVPNTVSSAMPTRMEGRKSSRIQHRGPWYGGRPCSMSQTPVAQLLKLQQTVEVADPGGPRRGPARITKTAPAH